MQGLTSLRNDLKRIVKQSTPQNQKKLAKAEFKIQKVKLYRSMLELAEQQSKLYFRIFALEMQFQMQIKDTHF